MPHRTILSAVEAVMSRPSKTIRPSPVGTKPEMARSVVLFPAPFAPISVTISPAWIWIEIP